MPKTTRIYRLKKTGGPLKTRLRAESEMSGDSPRDTARHGKRNTLDDEKLQAGSTTDSPH
ncbi:MAG: hypothetical protein GXP26_11050 [Planctomycetes bacterium]|nr:hypothetical protein [Planctomycetota bacterium]